MLKICLNLALLAATASGQCESVPPWSPFGLSCYILLPGSQSFASHRANCENLGGWLVSISSAEENTFINELQQAGCSGSSCPAAFIGLARNGAGQFTNWLDGTLFGGTAYSNWNTDEPNNGGEGCAEIIKDSGKWNDISCSNNRQAMCEKPQPATWCESGWSPFGQCCYRLVPFTRTFDDHSSDCQNSGGQLVSISSEAENNFVKRKLVEKLQQAGCSGPSCPASFIGLRRDNADQFTSWLDGSPFGGSFYANWNSGEPDNLVDSDGCAAIIETGKWNDVPCNANYLTICKKCQPSATTSPTTTTTTPTTTTTVSTTTTTPSTTTPSTTVSTIQQTTLTSTTVGNFDCRTVRTNVNCGAANGPAACDAQCRLFKYGRGICYSFGTTTCPGYPLGSKGCLCHDTLDCRTLRTQVNCGAANAATSCTSWCKLFQWTRGVCTTFQSSWVCPGYAAGQAACLCQ